MALAPVNRSVLATARSMFGYGAKSTTLAFMADGLLPYMESVMGVEIPRADLDALLAAL